MAFYNAGSGKEKLPVAAIDIGTTHSGYAFSFHHDYKNDPAKISVNKAWFAGTASLMSLKAPTAVLFNEKKEFESFGYEAENMYSEYAEVGEDRKHYFFNRFKMQLHQQKINREFMLSDTHSRKMPAIRVFGEIINYLKNRLIVEIQERYQDVYNTDIHWVITVPAIWDDFAKQFMRESVYWANIDESHLSVVTEPVAASLYCQLIPTDKIHGSEGAKFTEGRPGSKYMVIDLGGGTVDVTVHERQVDGGLKEVYKTSDGACCGTMVDKEFEQLIINILSDHAFKKFFDEHSEDRLDFFREIEMKKRTITPRSTGKIALKVPPALAEAYETITRDTVKNAIENSPYKGKIRWLSGKVRIDAEISKGLFKPYTDYIVKHIKDILKYKELKGTNTFLMVGEFSESEMVQEAIMKALPGMNVIIPDEAGLSVMKGAVMFGHRPVTVTSRVSKYTNETKLDESHRSSRERRDKNSHGCGLLSCLRTNSPVRRKNDQEEDYLENLTFEIPQDLVKSTKAAKNVPQRTIAPLRGTPDWYKHHYKTYPRSPSYWTVYTDNKTLKDWRLDFDDSRPRRIQVDMQTFDAVKKVALATWQSQRVGHGRDAKGLDNLHYSNIQIRTVERIENCELFEKYALKRQEMFHDASKRGAFQGLENVKGSSGEILTTHTVPKDSALCRDIYPEINEHYVFHGTQESVVDTIMNQGLDCRLAGTRAMFGQGVYAAESSSKSDQYTDPKFNRTNSEKKMFLIRMCLGKIYVENNAKHFARAPCMMCYKDKCSCKDNSFFDSVVGDGRWKFREFVVYDRTQVYPEYLITYVRI